MRHVVAVTLALAIPVLAGAPALGAPVVRASSGANAAGIQATVDQFRADLGGALNPPGGAAQASGRREIDWDNIADSGAAPNPFQPSFYNANNVKGVVLRSESSTGFQVSADSANPTATTPEFGHINGTYPTALRPFSGERLFSPIGGSDTEVALPSPR